MSRLDVSVECIESIHRKDTSCYTTTQVGQILPGRLLAVMFCASRVLPEPSPDAEIAIGTMSNRSTLQARRYAPESLEIRRNPGVKGQGVPGWPLEPLDGVARP